ncbi:toprim domain-containing protein [Larkinella sp. C7]|uniref:toprim domain-containing protein n=1 Tax=Larkinella sp. C7 TaxID=2576607 RepID=UPI0011115751|nr:toprim domain-containing protein [Larkinella sp. C7]
MTKFDELKQLYPNLIPVPELRANVSIVELAAQYGYEPKPEKGLGRPVLQHPKHGDTIIIKNPQDASQQVYQRAGDFSDSGTIIDFIRNRLPTVFSMFNRPGQNEFRSITNVLYDYLRIDPTQVAQNRKVIDIKASEGQRQSFTRDLFDLRPLVKDNYLLKRNIDPRIINGPEFAGKVFTQVSYLNAETGHTEDFLTAKAHPDRRYITFHNVAFPYYNGLSAEVMGLELRNENLKQHAAGSDRYKSVFLSNIPEKPVHFVVLESVLDAMAHKQLRSIRGDDAFDSVYFSTGGQLTQEQTNTITRYAVGLSKGEGWKIVLAFDNDLKGHQFDLQFVQQLVSPHFPMSPAVATGDRIGLVLPSDESHRPAVDALLKRMELFNNTIRGQIQAPESDDVTKKELSCQLINIATQANAQLSLHIPSTIAAMKTVSSSLLDITGLSNRILIDKSCSKDFTDDLKRHVERGKKFAYSITDESGKSCYTSSSAVTIQRALIHLQHQYTGEGGTKTFTVQQQQPDGWLKQQAHLNIKDGKVVSASQLPDFKKQVLVEKSGHAEQVAEKRQEVAAKPEVDSSHKSASIKIKPQ